MQQQLIKISLLKNNTGQVEGLPKNPRLIKDQKYAKLKASLEADPEMMELREVIAYDNDGELVVICGNMRLRALKELGVKEVPVKVLPKETPPEKLRAYTIKDNVGFGEDSWDDLANDWDAVELEEWGLELPDLFEDAQEVEAQEDDYESPDIDTVQTDIVPGDLFEIGEHRLLCGDSTDSDAVAKLLDGKEPYLMVTDPPYGVEYSAEWRNEALRSDGSTSDGRAVGKVKNDDNADWSLAWALSPSKVAYVYHAGVFSGTVQQSLQNCNYVIRSQIIWVKSNFAISRADYHWKHEPCWYAVKKGSKGNWASDRKQNTVWEIAKPSKSETGHSTQKPVECMARPIGNHDGDVYDPFLGSGTTMVAAEQLGRKCYGMELDPKYCAVIIDRMIKAFPGIEIKKNGEPYIPEAMS